MEDKDTAPYLWLACLCAAWCRTCDDYQPVLRQVAAGLATLLPGLRLRWIDIEDEAELVGDCDVETFPTLLIADAVGVRFFGPVTPQPETLARLLRAQGPGNAVAHPAVPEGVRALAARLREPA